MNEDDIRVPPSWRISVMYAPGPGVPRSLLENLGVSDKAHEFDPEELRLEDVRTVLAVKVLLEDIRVAASGMVAALNAFRGTKLKSGCLSVYCGLKNVEAAALPGLPRLAV